MNTVDGQIAPDGSPGSEPADLKLEAVVIPVADADRSKAFYAGLGWRLDADFSFDNGFRVVQFTPPGSQCSVQFGTHITGAPPGSAHGLYLIVSDIEAGSDDLVSRGPKVSGVFHSGAPGAQLDPEGASDRVSGPDPDRKSYNSFATFEDPDGNSWLLQEVTHRLPGRLDPTTTSFNSAGDLAAALRRAESAHGEHEKRIGHGSDEVERLIRTAGFEPMRIGGIEQSSRLEVGGDLHDLVVGSAEARSLVVGA
jgi:catechol 2,3-dioxygenase-like lactoylglutathione lyase family enzyme